MVVEGLLSVVTVVMLVAGAIRIQAESVTPAQVITIAYLLSLLFIPIRIIGFMLWDMSHSTAAWRRIQRVLNADELVEYGTLETRLWPSGAEVDGISIGFGYQPDQPILLDVHLDDPLGQGRRRCRPDRVGQIDSGHVARPAVGSGHGLDHHRRGGPARVRPLGAPR